MSRSWKKVKVVLAVLIPTVFFLGCYMTISPIGTMPVRSQSIKRPVTFLETSGKGFLDLRQLACVESAAKFIPNGNVTVFVFSDEKFTYTPGMVALRDTYSVSFVDTSVWDFMRGTPMEPWYVKGVWKSSPYVVSHTSDALRYLALWKFGGVYLDLDVIMIREWNELRNVIVRENNEFLAAGIMIFEKGHPVLVNCMEWLVNHYDPRDWGANGPGLITRMWTEYQKAGNNDVVILPPSTFYEIYYPEYMKFFDSKFTGEVLNRTEGSFGVHLWNAFASKVTVPFHSVCAYNVFLNRSSPLISSTIAKNPTS